MLPLDETIQIPANVVLIEDYKNSLLNAIALMVLLQDPELAQTLHKFKEEADLFDELHYDEIIQDV